MGVDEHAKHFFVYRDLITSRSKFFAKALRKYGEGDNGDITWLEGEEGIIKLPEDNPDVFAYYLQLIYQGQVPAGKAFKGDVDAMSEDELEDAISNLVNAEYERLSKLYIFCEKVRDTTGKVLLIAAFVEAYHKKREDGCPYFPVSKCVTKVYEGTMDGDPLRQFCVDCYALQAHAQWFENEKAEEYNLQFLFDVMKEMANARDQVTDYSEIKSAEAYCKKLLDTEQEEDGGSTTPAQAK